MNKKIGRNDPCSCNSGKKYKQCCLKNAPKPYAEIEADFALGERLVREFDKETKRFLAV